MRSIAGFAAALLLPLSIQAQGPAGRYVEVLVTDTVRLSFAGMDFEVRMENPFQIVNEGMTRENGKDGGIEKMIDAAEQKAKANEQLFVDQLAANQLTYRLSETEIAQDFAFGTRKTFEVKTYLVQLKTAAEMEKYQALTESSDVFIGTPQATHYGDPSSEAPRLMSKLFAHGTKEAEALAAVAGGHLGKLLSAQELPQTEGSVMQMLLTMDKGSREERQMTQGSMHTSTMAFRFELLD